MTSLRLVIIAILVLSIVALVLITFTNCRFAVAFGVEWWKKAATIVQTIVMLIAIVALVYNHISNERSQKLFVGANIPLIDVTPIGISQVPDKNGTYHSATYFDIANYSGFDAMNIGIDVKYGDNPWIAEWIKADRDKNSKKPGEKIIDNNMYMSAPIIFLSKLEAGRSTRKIHQSDEDFAHIRGQLDLEKDVCSQKSKGITVLIRVTWQNENDHVFDEVHKYTLICTTVPSASQTGYSFTFIPEGIVYKKDAKYSQ